MISEICVAHTCAFIYEGKNIYHRAVCVQLEDYYVYTHYYYYSTHYYQGSITVLVHPVYSSFLSIFSPLQFV